MRVLRQPAIAEQSRFMSTRGLLRAWKSQLLPPNFDEFSACSDAESIFGGVVRVSVLVAPLGVLLVVYMPTDRPRDQNDGCADDESPSYQRFHFCPASRRPLVGEAATPIVTGQISERELVHEIGLSKKYTVRHTDRVVL